MKEFLLIFAMTLVTFGVRYPSLALVSKFDLPITIQRALRYVPVAVLTAITLPYVLYRDTGFSFSYTNSYLVAGIVAVFVGWRSKNLLLTIGIGLIFFFGYRFIIN